MVKENWTNIPQGEFTLKTFSLRIWLCRCKKGINRFIFTLGDSYLLNLPPREVLSTSFRDEGHFIESKITYPFIGCLESEDMLDPDHPMNVCDPPPPSPFHKDSTTGTRMECRGTPDQPGPTRTNSSPTKNLLSSWEEVLRHWWFQRLRGGLEPTYSLERESVCVWGGGAFYLKTNTRRM